MINGLTFFVKTIFYYVGFSAIWNQTCNSVSLSKNIGLSIRLQKSSFIHTWSTLRVNLLVLKLLSLVRKLLQPSLLGVKPRYYFSCCLIHRLMGLAKRLKLCVTGTFFFKHWRAIRFGWSFHFINWLPEFLLFDLVG